MSSRHDLERLKKDNNFYKAYEVLQNIIHHHCPDIKLLNNLYGNKAAAVIKNHIEYIFSTTKNIYFLPRNHSENPAFEIYEARSKIESEYIYQKIHSALLLNRVPEIQDLIFFYGNYSETVYNIFNTYLQYGLKRKCELFAATHLHRVGAVVFQMGMNDPGSFKYSSISVLHDSIEDLFNLTKDSSGNIIGLLNYKKFLDDFLPEELQSSIKILTNHYDLILKFILDKLQAEDKSISKKNILKILNYLIDLQSEEINIYIEKMANLIDNFDFSKENDLILTAKWMCYKNLYLDNIAESSVKANDFRLFEIKGVDLSDNSHGKDALSVNAKIRNILKNTLWGTKGYTLHSTWIPLNRHIQEIIEDSLCAAEYIILKDLLEVQSCVDFVMSALIKFRKLELIFYT
jgi:hypothetical protein